MVILGGSESLSSSDRESGVSGDEVSHNATSSLESNVEGSHVKSGNLIKLLVFSREDGRLDSGTIGNTLITVNVRVESLSLEGLGKDALNFGDFARSSNKYDLINVFRGKSGFFNASLNGSSNLLH